MADPVVPPVVPAVVIPPVVEPPAQPTLAEVQARLANAEKALKESNHENADRRTKLVAFEKAEADRVTAALSETEKLNKRVADAEKAQAVALSTANERLVRAEVIAKAAGLKFNDPADALALIDRSKLTVSEDGTVSGADEQLKALALAKPYMLVKAAQAALHPGNPGYAGEPQETDRQKLDRIYGANGASQVFGSREAKERGGGVIFPKTE
jgi:Phage minor structural protein GP20